MRFGRPHAAPADEPAWNDPQSVPPAPALAAAPEPAAAHEVLVRHARKDGKPVATIRAVDHGSCCVVEAEVLPHGASQIVRPGPYTFSDVQQASVFVTEAVTALMCLGCDIQTQ